ncbi:unnamed protein product [Brachionus calyciflorus]|uniref:Uncharacterized protein n=1 Tax=Brachionus calyciflorus TaxID=104777 RepID=A0A814G5Z3_9BILA|nr:unnamed protein product [Brachionus calyciflorus]
MKYIVIIKNEPFDKNSDQKREYTDVTISSDGVHSHDKTLRLKGESRLKIAEEISNKFHGLTRLTNGSIENFNRFSKKDAPKNLLPHAHINFNSNVIIVGVVIYIEKVSSSLVSIKRKQIDKIVKDHYEEDIHDAVEIYAKKIKVEVPFNQGYQKPINVENLIDVDNKFTQQQSNSNVKYKIKNYGNQS